MPLTPEQILRFLNSVYPYDALPPEQLEALATKFEVLTVLPGDWIYKFGRRMDGLYLIHEGRVEVTDGNGEVVSRLGLRNSFGERGLLRDGVAVTSAQAEKETVLLMLPAAEFDKLIATSDAASRFFTRTRDDRPQQRSLASTPVESLMVTNPKTCTPTDTARHAAQVMRDLSISALPVHEDGTLAGIVTTGDLARKLVADARPFETPVREIMTPDPVMLSPSALGSDVLHMMMERNITHIPVVRGDALVGIVSQTDLTRFQAVSSAELVRAIAGAATSQEMAEVTAQIPELLVQLIAAGNRHEIVTRLITDIADTCTRRLLTLAEEKLGPPPVPYLWLACGSQGRQEQTGVSDQDNCLFLHDDVTDAQREGYFADLAKFVCDGLDVAGYFYCPGDMMATNPRWCQPVSTWKGYFDRWIRKPDQAPEKHAEGGVEKLDLRGAYGVELAQAHAAAGAVARPRHDPLRRAQERDRHETQRRRAHRRPRPHLRASGQAARGQHPRPARSRRPKRQDFEIRRAGSARRLRPDRRDAASAPGRGGQARHEARQLPRARPTLGFRTQPPARRFRRRENHAIGHRPRAGDAQLNPRGRRGGEEKSCFWNWLPHCWLGSAALASCC